MKKFNSSTEGNAAIVLLVLVLVGISAAALLGYVALTPKGQAYIPSSAGAGGAPVYVPPPAAQAAGPLTPAQMDAANQRNTQGLGLALTARDQWAGATTTTGGFTFWGPSTEVSGSNPLIIDTVTPGTTDTRYAVVSDGYYQMAYTDPSAAYYSHSICPQDGELAKTTTPCQVPVAYNPRIANPVYTASFNVRRIGALVDPVDESSTTDAQGIQWANGQSNITVPEGGDVNTASRCIVSSTVVAGTQFTSATAGTSAPTNGNVLFFNDTACGGSLYITFAVECSTSANRWCLDPTMTPVWAQLNGTGNEYTSATLTPTDGSLFTPQLTDITANVNSQNQRPVRLGASDWIQSATINHIKLALSYTAANFAKGKCQTYYFDDQGGYLGWMINQTLVGGAATSFELCRAA